MPSPALRGPRAVKMLGCLDVPARNGHTLRGRIGEVDAMARRLRQTWTARIVAATLSLALVVVSIVGAGAHAHHDLHAHPHSSISVPDASAVGHRPGPADLPEPAHQRSSCIDFICHGGLAVLPPASPWDVAVWPEATVFPRNGQPLAAVGPARLDRPPKSLVSV